MEETTQGLGGGLIALIWVAAILWFFLPFAVFYIATVVSTMRVHARKVDVVLTELKVVSGHLREIRKELGRGPS